MKSIKRMESTTEFRNSLGEDVTVHIDFFFREVKIWRPGIDSDVKARAIDASAVHDMCWWLTANNEEQHDLMQEVYHLMDDEGKIIMSKVYPELKGD